VKALLAVLAVVAVLCVGCGHSASPDPLDSQLDQIRSTLDSVQAQLGADTGP
jgi:hypothetical protein